MLARGLAEYGVAPYASAVTSLDLRLPYPGLVYAEYAGDRSDVAVSPENLVSSEDLPLGE